MSKIKFRIISFSSEDSQYPASELLTQSPQSRGWQSARFCDFPQEITFQFMSPIRLKQLQILCHQSKIPSKIEIFVYLPDLTSPIENNEFRYKKLGYISLDSNERSGFQARELKSVFLENPCLYMKLVFHKCHINKFNFFNQISLIAISVFGDYLTVNNVAKPSKGVSQLEKLEYETQFDPKTLDKLKLLESAKEKAIKIEDFEEANKLKEAIDRLKIIGVQLQELEERKNIAVQNDDFKSAQIIKVEADKLREMAFDYVGGKKHAQNMQKVDLPPVIQSGHRPWSDDKNQPISQPSIRQNNENNEISKKYQKPQESPFIKNSQNNKNQQVPENEMANTSEVINEVKSPKKEINKKALQKEMIDNHDERVLPAVLKNNAGGKNNNFENEYPEEKKDQPQKPDQMTPEILKICENMIDYITERCCGQLFSKQWSIREEGLKFLESELKRPTQIKTDDQSGLFQAVMGAINYTISDKIVQVSQRSISVLIALLSKPPGKITAKGELPTYIENILVSLLEKIGDNNARMKELAEAAFLAMGNNSIITSQVCVNSLIKGIQGEKNKKSSSFKHLSARLNVLIEYVRSFGINNNNIPFAPVVDFAVKHLEHQNAEVRNAAIGLLVEISKCVGEDKLMPLLENVRPAQMEMLQLEFNSNGNTNIPKIQKKQEEKVVVTTNSSNKPAVKNKEIVLKKGGIVDKEKTCSFCGKIDKLFLENGKLDIHLWKECPMLHICSMCNQVVEISCLNSHYFEECEFKKNFKKCPRCKEAIHNNNYKEHTEEMACLNAKNSNVANRCPLCHTDIMPGENGWKSHLMAEGCPNNERGS